MSRIHLFWVLTLFVTQGGWADEPRILQRIERTITREPVYHAEQPLYGLVVIGPQASTRYWVVLDKSSRDVEKHDVAYVDLNGNGDLTESNEKFAAEKAGSKLTFQFPDIVDPTTGKKHPDFKLSISDRDPPTQMVSLLWRGEQKFGGGYPEDPEDGYLRFGASPAAAPILWLNGDGPFRFQRWYSGELRIGEADDVKVFLGLPGVGRSSFCAFQRHVLPEDEPVLTTLIYTDKDGKERQVRSMLEDRC